MKDAPTPFNEFKAQNFSHSAQKNQGMLQRFPVRRQPQHESSRARVWLPPGCPMGDAGSKTFSINGFATIFVTKETNALSFYRSQNVLGRSKFFVPDQTFIYILWQSQTFCARQKDDLHSVKLFFVPAQKYLKRH